MISNRPESIKNIQILDGIGSSDHNIVSLKLTCKVTRPYQRPKQIFDYKNANWDNFRLELSNIPWDAILNDNDTMEEVWLNWKSAFFKAIENNVPSKKIKSRQNVPGSLLIYASFSTKENAFGRKPNLPSLKLIGININR